MYVMCRCMIKFVLINIFCHYTLFYPLCFVNNAGGPFKIFVYRLVYDPGFKPYQCLLTGTWKRTARLACWPPRGSAGVTLDVNLMYALPKCKYGCPLWFWNPEETSPEVQNRGISGSTKRLVSSKFF